MNPMSCLMVGGPTIRTMWCLLVAQPYGGGMVDIVVLLVVLVLLWWCDVLVIVMCVVVVHMCVFMVLR